MPMKKSNKKQNGQVYYTLDKILQVDAQYNIILGERSNGKSYAMKRYAISRAWADPTQHRFVVLRRWDTEIKPKYIEQYFRDTPIDELTHHACDGVDIYQGKIYLTKSDEETGKTEKKLCVGYVRALSIAQTYKSGAYDDVDTVIFEEFLSKTTYLPNEPTELQDFISTIARRREIKVFLIGNTITRLCPYFQEWQLNKTVRQKAGTIEVYEEQTLQRDEDGNPIVLLVAVELCGNSGTNSKMFFGASSGMIVAGKWQASEHEHLTGKIREYNTIYTAYFKCYDFRFRGDLLMRKDDGTVVWFISPKSKGDMQQRDRVIVDRMPLYGMLTTIGLIPLSDGERQAFSYLYEGKICYSDNETGSDFERSMEVWRRG